MNQTVRTQANRIHTSSWREKMEREEKRAYNREHYQKNRQRVLEKAKQQPRSQSKVIALFAQSNTRPPRVTQDHHDRWHRHVPLLHLIAMILLVVAMSYFLVTESIKFYLAHDGNRTEAVLKALILEGVVIVFAMQKGKSKIQAIFHKMMIALIYSYSVWLLSGSIIQSSLAEHRQFETQHSLAQDLQSTIARKETMRDSYWNANRFTLARKYDLAIDDLKQRLTQTRSELVHLSDPVTVFNTLATLIIFRILVMCSNLLCIQHLGQLLKVRVMRV